LRHRRKYGVGPVGTYLADSLDDLMRESLTDLIAHGRPISPTRGPARELLAVRLELSNPRVRLSRSLARGKPFSCLGELIWYLAGSDDVEQIEYYVRKYRDEAEADGTVYAAYGTRLFGSGRLETAIETLRTKRDSRQAVVPLLDAEDLRRSDGHVPCTSTLQFLLRDGVLDLIVSMRSNDAYLGLPHDVFAFTMLQEIVARSVDAEMGTYIHLAGSFHLYEEHLEHAKAFLDEGLTLPKPMPPMPAKDPRRDVEMLVQAEASLRLGGTVDFARFSSSYWADLARLLGLFACEKNGLGAVQFGEMRQGIDAIEVYGVFLNDRFGAEGDTK
jgi:thymidylate synthase